MRMDLIKGTPCEPAIERAVDLARQILAGELDPFVGGRQIAGLGSVDCYDFLNEVDVVGEMAAFWQISDDLEHRRILGLPFEDTPSVRAEIAEGIRRAARTLLVQFGPKTDEPPLGEAQAGSGDVTGSN
jgi:hypothetical protein